jgi:predicted ATPase/class 3 adenylate cyclase
MNSMSSVPDTTHQAPSGPGIAVAGDDQSSTGVHHFIPDGRLRVFVSSTIGELAAEREAAKTAIRTLRLAPVMFDLGARPHPPRDLYRSYLAESDIFVGIYWQSYGWTAPDMEISGIEDEFRLAGDRPRLIYVKEPAGQRDPALQILLDQIRPDGGVAYRQFESAGELAELLLDDLARLMTQHFDASPRRVELPGGTLTFLFSDIEDSTRLVQDLGERYPAVLGAYRSMIRATVNAHNGQVVDTEGDGTFSVFTEPANAARAAVEIQRTLGLEPFTGGEDDGHSDHAPGIRARVGLHTGRATVTPEGYVGLDVHRAARIGASGHGGQIIVSSTASSLLADVIAGQEWHLRDLGAFALKGLSRSEHLFQLQAPGLAEEFPPPRARQASEVHLPAQLTSLVGRGPEIAQVGALLSRPEVRLVTLSGSGGIGKTRLAVAVAAQVAADYPDGVLFVGLAGVRDPDQVMTAIAEAIGTTINRSSFEAVADHFATKRALLILDNFEQVVAGAPALTRLLTRCPGINMLVTSRVALRVIGEHEYLVPPLPVPSADTYGLEAVQSSAAVNLFVERARSVRPDFSVNVSNADDVAGIVRRLDGLPLAIELAAARLRMLTPATLLTQLARSFDALGHGPQDLPARQRTLRATIDWSHDLLTVDERQIFRRLSVLAQSWSLEAAVALADLDIGPTMSLLESLVEKSLLRIESDSDGEPRFRMLATVREYGQERLRDAGEYEALQNRHATHYRDLAEELVPGLNGAGHGAAMRRLDLEWENLRLAVLHFAESGDIPNMVRLIYSLWIYVWVRGHVAEVGEWMRKAGPPDPGLPAVSLGRLMWLTGGTFFERGDHSEALAAFERSIDVLSTTDDLEGLAWATYLRAATLPAFDASAAELRDMYIDSLERFRAIGTEWGETWAHTSLGLLAASSGDIAEAANHYRNCLEIAERLENRSMLAMAHTQLGFTHLAAGEIDQARVSLGLAVEIHRTIAYREGLVYTLEALAGLAMQEADASRAMIALGAAEATRDRLSLRPWPAAKWYFDFLVMTADAVADPEFVAARLTGRQMDPMTAATVVLGQRL